MMHSTAPVVVQHPLKSSLVESVISIHFLLYFSINPSLYNSTPAVCNYILRLHSYVVYSGKLLREKTFTNFVVYQQKFSLQKSMVTPTHT